MSIVAFRLDSCKSTNVIARDFLDRSGQSPDVIVARKQTQGKGRSGSWWSPEDCGIYMSVIRPPTKSLQNRNLANKDITESIRICMLDFSYGLTDTLSQYFCLTLEQQGDNDIYLAGRKLAGILCEYHATSDKLIVGVGLNTFKPVKIRKDLEGKAIWLNEYAAEYLIDQDKLVKMIAEELLKI